MTNKKIAEIRVVAENVFQQTEGGYIVPRLFLSKSLLDLADDLEKALSDLEVANNRIAELEVWVLRAKVAEEALRGGITDPEEPFDYKV